jgi:hypothetical protein
MDEIEQCKLCGKIFTDTLQLLRAALVIEHFEVEHPGVDPGMDSGIDQPIYQLKVS